MKSLSAYRFVGRFAVHVHPRGALPDAELDAFFRDLTERLATIQLIVVWTDGEMNAKQRATTKHFQEKNPIQSIVFTIRRSPAALPGCCSGSAPG
jgi:hypothetical protein